MNLMLLSQNIKKMGMIPEESEMIEIPDDELYENRLKVRKIHDIDIHVFSSLLFNDIEAEDDVERYPYKIEHDDSCFGEPKYFPNDNKPYIVIDRYKDSALKDGLTCVKPKDYCIVKIDDREYHVETPLNLLANKIAFSLNQADFYSYFARKGNFQIDNNELNNISADMIFIDPPRKGCDKVALDTIMKICPKKIVYVSCNPATLARDLKILSEKYDIGDVTPVDMFPFTSHVECVAVLQLKN